MTTILESPQVERRASAGQADLSSRRIHYFDWLRALAVLGVIAYHTVLPFARDTWGIVNGQQSQILLGFVFVLESFGLVVLFLVAGASVRFALQRRSPRSFLAERAIRLLVPYVVGAIVLVPATNYIIGRHLGTVSGSYLSFLAGYPRWLWTNRIVLTGVSPQILDDVGMHLWFLAWLFICSALVLPVFLSLASSAGRSLVDALGRLSRWRGAVLLLALPMMVPRVILAALYPSYSRWGPDSFAWYALVLIMGYVLYCDDRLIAAARRELWPALAVALLGSYAFLSPEVVWRIWPQTYLSIPFWTGVLSITGWAWTLVILSLGMRARSMQRPLPALASEAALPAYVLHFPIVIAISALVVEWPFGFGAKVLLNVLLGLGATLLVAAAVIQIPALRPLLGLHQPRLAPRPAAAA